MAWTWRTGVKIPEKKEEAYKKELERLCSLGIIEVGAGTHGLNDEHRTSCKIR